MFLFADWNSTERKAAIQKIADQAVARVWADATLRVPRTQEERTNGFLIWVERHRPRFVADIRELAQQHAPSEETWTQGVIGRVWPQIAHELRRYAIRGLAFRWVRDEFVESIYPGEPQLKDDGLWYVDLLRQGHDECIGVLLLDSEGEVVQVESQIPPRTGHPQPTRVAA